MKHSLLKTAILAVALTGASSLSTQAGWIKRYVYSDITGTAVTNLFGTNTSGVIVFPDSPTEIQLIPPGPWDINLEAVSGIDVSDNYGSWTPGYIEPPETGNYRFWVSGDDEVQLWLTSDAADSLNPAKSQMIARVPGYSAPREFTKFPEQQSELIYLEKGKQYYMEAYQKEGTGGDSVGWGWTLPSGLIERPMRTFYLQPKKDLADSVLATGPSLAPIIPNALDPTIYDGREIMLWVDVNLVPPYNVTWLRGGAEISGANQTYYRMRARTSDNGAQFSVRVNGTVYGPLTLNVNADTTAPQIQSAVIPVNNPRQILLVFSETVTPATAANAANYTLNTATVQNAELQADGRTVVLTTTLLNPNQGNLLTVNGIQDFAIPANTLSGAQTNLAYADGFLTYRIWYTNSYATSLATLRTWSAVDSTAPSYANNLFDEERLITTSSYQWNLVPLRNNFLGQMVGYIIAPQTGNYRFAVASDDHGLLYLGTNELASSKREIASGDGATGRWNLGQRATQVSAAIPLEAGKRYYIEAVFREGTGGDGVTIAWETPANVAAGTLLPNANSSVQAATEPFLLPAANRSSFGAFGNVFLSKDLPATLSVAESAAPTLQVTADGTRAFGYQWYKNNAAIAGAGAASYTLPYVTLADGGSTYYVVATNSFSAVTSTVTTLTVTSDSTKPVVASVGSLYKQLVEVRFSKPVTAVTATNPANYSLFSSTGTPVALTGVVADTNDAAHITLQTAPMPETDMMRLVVQNLVDTTAGANMMSPQTNSFQANNFEALARINNSQAYSASANGDRITMTAGGADIWGNADQQAFLYKTITGNFDYRVRAITVPPVNGWTKMGLMARVSTASGSRNAAALFTPVTPGQNQYTAQIRDTTGGASTSANDAGTLLNMGLQIGIAPRPTVAIPSWLRLQRVGDSIYYYISANGTNWTYWTTYNSLASAEGPLPASLLVGMALTSHDTANTATTVIESFSAVDDGVLRFTTTPTNAIVAEGANAVFTSAVAGHSPWFFEWSKNGTPIPDATNATLTLKAVPFSDNGSTLTLRVSNPYNETLTANVTLSVLEPDTTKPTVASVGSLFKNVVEVYFSEGVTAASAGDVANYTLATAAGATVAVSGATVDWEDAKHVTLNTAAMPDAGQMQLTCRNIVDLSVGANVMIAQTTPFRANNFDMLEAVNSTQAVSARANGDQITITAGGADIWGTADAFGYLYKSVSGNFDYAVQGISLPLVNSWSKMGIMVRNAPAGGLTGGDINAFTCFTPAGGQNTYSPQIRPDFGAASTSSDTAGAPLNVGLQPGQAARPTVVYPSWLRLQRFGNIIYYYYSTTGTNWTFWTYWDSSTSASGPLPNDVLLGLAITSHDAALLVTGVMSSFTQVQEGALKFVVQPSDTVVMEGGNATFTNSVIGKSPYSFQWMKNGANIAGATGASLALTNIPFSDNGSVFSVRVSNPFGESITSTNALLTVVKDTFKPVVQAVGSLRGTGIGVYFTDVSLLDPATASNPANYTVNGGAVTVTSATLEQDGLAVMLGLSAPVSGDFTVLVQNVKDASPLANVMDPVTLQSTVVDWPLNQDVGLSTGTPPVFSDPLMPGFAQAIGTDGFYLHAGGHDIWDAADGFHFVYQALTGDYDVAARVAGLRLSDVWAKAGLMVRAELTADSRNYTIAATPTNGNNLITMQWRLDKAAASGSLPDNLRPRPALIPNAWLRVTRADQVFSFYYGTNGTDWVNLYTTNEVATPYPSTVYVGLAATSHNNGASPTNTTGAYFRDIKGLVAPASAPSLRVSLEDSNIVISWTSADAGFSLQSTATLGSGWAADPATIVTAGNNHTVTVPISAGPKFYRLKK